MKWYVLKVVPGKERSLCELLNQHINIGKLKNVNRFVCPTETDYVTVRKKKIRRDKVIYNGYVYLESNELLNDDILTQISNYPSVMGLLGNKKPMLMSDADVKKILKDDVLDKHNENRLENYQIGDKILITKGIFENFTGTLHKINNDSVIVMVEIFGKNNEISLSLSEIKKQK